MPFQYFHKKYDPRPNSPTMRGTATPIPALAPLLRPVELPEERVQFWIGMEEFTPTMNREPAKSFSP
jgi:hypothetical protein